MSTGESLLFSLREKRKRCFGGQGENFDEI